MKALVWFVSVVMALIYTSVFVVCVFPNADFFFGTVLGYFKMMLMSSVLGMVVLSYHRIITTPPGFVPRGWKPSDIEEHEAEEVIEKFRRMDSDNIDSRERQRLREEVRHFKYRYCVKCDAFKPPRSHHCRECNACVLRMDHHCPWVNNCVGHYNHKYFMVFLLWGLVGIGYGAMMFLVKIGWMLKNISDGVPHNMTPIQGIIIISNFCLILPMSLGMLSLLVYHLELAATNTTTIEYNDRYMAMKEARRNKREYIWPYDFGWKQNLDLFFGKSILLWCLPVPSDRWNFDPCHYPTVPISPALELIA